MAETERVVVYTSAQAHPGYDPTKGFEADYARMYPAEYRRECPEYVPLMIAAGVMKPEAEE